MWPFIDLFIFNFKTAWFQIFLFNFQKTLKNFLSHDSLSPADSTACFYIYHFLLYNLNKRLSVDFDKTEQENKIQMFLCQLRGCSQESLHAEQQLDVHCAEPSLMRAETVCTALEITLGAIFRHLQHHNILQKE